jgi:hypothetical protein
MSLILVASGSHGLAVMIEMAAFAKTFISRVVTSLLSNPKRGKYYD